MVLTKTISLVFRQVVRLISWTEYWIILAVITVCMFICRVAPALLLKGRTLSPRATEGLNLIAPAAFAALVANDLFSPGLFASGFWPDALPFIASLVVLFVARKTKSLLICAIAGVGMYAILTFIV